MPPRGTKAPDHVFVAPSPLRRVVTLLALLALVGAVATGWWAVQHESTTGFAVAATSAVVLVLCWGSLAASQPQRVTITGSVVEVRRTGSSTSYDLEDPGVDLMVRDGSVAFGHYRDDWTVVQARDVDWPVFTDVVMRYQQQADHNAEERDRRFSR